MSDWIGLPENITEEEHFGIIYCITNNITNKKYIGKKQLWSTTKRPPLKGKTRKRKVTKSSDYLNYYGSSEELKKEVSQYGKENFTREVLGISSCKWESAWLEMMWQIKLNVLNSDDFHNGIINIRLGVVPKHLKEKYKNFWVDFGFNHDTH
jgi:hypothetical protein